VDVSSSETTEPFYAFVACLLTWAGCSVAATSPCCWFSRGLGLRILAIVIYFFAFGCAGNVCTLAWYMESQKVLYQIHGTIAFFLVMALVVNMLLESFTICFCRNLKSKKEYPLYRECCACSIGMCTTKYRPGFRYTIYAPGDFEMLPQSRYVMSSACISTSDRPRLEHWCNTFGRNITCNGCFGNYCRDPLGKKSKTDRTWKEPSAEVQAQQLSMIRNHAMKQRHMAGGATGAGGTPNDPAGTMARFGPRQRQDPNITAYANWDPNQHNQMDAYADYTSRHHDPRERSINDRYDDTIRAIQSGVIPSAEQTPMERRQYNTNSRDQADIARTESYFTHQAARTAQRPSGTGSNADLAAEASEYNMPEQEYRHIRAQSMQTLEGAQNRTNAVAGM